MPCTCICLFFDPLETNGHPVIVKRNGVLLTYILNRAAKPAISGHTAFFLEILANFYDIRSPLKFQSNPAWP